MNSSMADRLDALATSLADQHKENRDTLRVLGESVASLAGTVALNGQRLDGIIQRQGEANHRISKAEAAIEATQKAVEKDQYLTEAAKQWAEKETHRTRWMVATMFTGAGLVSGIVFSVLSLVT